MVDVRRNTRWTMVKLLLRGGGCGGGGLLPLLATACAWALAVGTVTGDTAAQEAHEETSRRWLANYNTLLERADTMVVNATWMYNTNLTDYNLQRQLEANLRRAKLQQEGARNASGYHWRNFKDADLRRQFSKIAIIGTASLRPELVERVDTLRGTMQKTYSTAKVCGRPGDTEEKCYSLDPDLTEIMANERSWDTLLWAWEGWRNQTGKKMKEQYTEFIDIHNQAAKKEGFEDAGDYWRSFYETETFEEDVARIWKEVEPMYKQLHLYVRKKLRQVYKGRKFPDTGHIPAHLLGNMWAQSWSNLYEDLVPFPGKAPVDVTSSLEQQGYDARRMFRLAEEFFTSLGLRPMPRKFWEHSMIVKPTDRDVVCHASAWDFYNRQDFRIAMCTTLTMEDLVTVHHEMGHTQYHLQYSHLPVVYRRGGNPGFHEAVGDVMSLSVSTPEHLLELGLLDAVGNDTESDLNYLFYMALEKIAFLPFGYMIDQWRWDVFRGNVKPDEYTKAWASLRCKYQGVSPPVMRTKDDFDPGAKYHIPGHTPYIRYFVSFIIQFQFHKSLCEAAGSTRPLHRCDIYRSKEAGDLLGNMLKLGSSKPWPDAMEQITGQRSMSASALMEYFQPLTDWLKEQNAGEDPDWDEQCPPGSFDDEGSGSSRRTASINLVLVALVLLAGVQLAIGIGH